MTGRVGGLCAKVCLPLGRPLSVGSHPFPLPHPTPPPLPLARTDCVMIRTGSSTPPHLSPPSLR